MKKCFNILYPGIPPLKQGTQCILEESKMNLHFLNLHPGFVSLQFWVQPSKHVSKAYVTHKPCCPHVKKWGIRPAVTEMCKLTWGWREIKWRSQPPGVASDPLYTWHSLLSLPCLVKPLSAGQQRAQGLWNPGSIQHGPKHTGLAARPNAGGCGCIVSLHTFPGKTYYTWLWMPNFSNYVRTVIHWGVSISSISFPWKWYWESILNGGRWKMLHVNADSGLAVFVKLEWMLLISHLVLFDITSRIYSQLLFVQYKWLAVVPTLPFIGC